MARRDNETMTNALMLVGGGIVGAGLGLLFAPRTGKQTRRDIARLARDVGRKTDKAVHSFADNVTDLAETAGKKAAGMVRSGKEMTHTAKKELLAAFERGEKGLKRQTRRMASMMG